jgi:hypothetical protein
LHHITYQPIGSIDMRMPCLYSLYHVFLLMILTTYSSAVQPPDQTQTEKQSSAAASKLRELQIGLAGAPVALFGAEDSPTFDAAFQQLADRGFDFFFPLFVIRETTEQSSYSAHGNYFFPASLTGAPGKQSCGGASCPYTAALGKIDIWYPGTQLLGLFDNTRPIPEQDFLNALAVHENECPNVKKAVSAFYSFDEPSLNHVVAHFSGQPQAATGNAATVARLVRQAWKVPVVIVDAPDESTIQTTGLPPPQMQKAVEMFWTSVREVAASQDGFGFNVYSIPDFRLTLAGDYCRKAKEAAPNQSIVSVIQGMSFAGITGDAKGGRAPTEDEVRFQAVDSLVAGADLLCWYGCSSLDLKVQRDQELWNSICKVTQEVKRIATTLRGENVAASFTTDLAYRCHVLDDRMGVLLVNRSNQQRIIPLDFASNCNNVEVIAGPEPEQWSDGRWQVDCPAFTACIFKFERHNH